MEAGICASDDDLLPDFVDGVAVVSAEQVRQALSRFGEVYECVKPYERKELVRLVLHRAEAWDRKIVLEINGGIAETMPLSESASSRFGTPNWLPDEDSNLEPSG